MKPVYSPYNFVAGGIKTTNLKPGHGITLMHILDLSGKILENTGIGYHFFDYIYLPADILVRQ